MLVHEKIGKLEYPEKNTSSETQGQIVGSPRMRKTEQGREPTTQQTEPRFDAESRESNQGHIDVSECTHHYAINAIDLSVRSK